MILYVFMATNASYYVFDVLTVDDANTLTIIGMCKYVFFACDNTATLRFS